MSNAPGYRRYVILEVRAGLGAPRVVWNAGVLTAAEGFELLESRIAEQVLTEGSVMWQVALVDCAEGRVLASHLPVRDAEVSQQLVAWAQDTATSMQGVGPQSDPDEGVSAPAFEGTDDLSASAAADDEEDAITAEEYEALYRRASAEVVSAFHDGGDLWFRLRRLLTLIDLGPEAYAPEDDIFSMVTRDSVRRWLAAVEPEDACETLGLADADELGIDAWIRYLAERMEDLYYDGDFSYCTCPFTLRDATGRSVVMTKYIQGYSFSGVELTYGGPWATREAFEQYLAADCFTDRVAFESLPREEQEAFVRSARPELG